MLFALIGNQNSGKTTLFNQLTGSNQHVGNFPGVTVEKKEGTIKKMPQVTIVDLPGIYSLSPYSTEEIVTRDFLLKEKPDAIINIVDATNIERNFYLTLQLLELNIPVIIALNMMDEVNASGNSIDVNMLAKKIGVPVVPISAIKNQGISELVDTAIITAEKRIKPKIIDFCEGAIHRAIHALGLLIEDHASAKNLPVRYAATRLIEGDLETIEQLQLNANELDILDHIIHEMEDALKMDKDAALADMRYNYIEELIHDTVHKKQETKEQIKSVKIDNILTHRYLAIPIFILIMGAVFWMTFGVIGAALSDLLALLISFITQSVDSLLTAYGLNSIIHSLIIDGIFVGVGSVLSFLPTIVVLFLFLSLLEDSGYMARVAFVMDKLLRKIGLSGRSFVPMLIGFGCSVPAIMATRTLSSERDRKMTILLTPYMSCSAKLPIYAVFSAVFFPQYAALVMMALYLLGIFVAILVGLLLRKTIYRGNPIPFIMELPSYRFPSVKTMLIHMLQKAKDFIRKAFTIIFIATIVIWFLQNFDFRINQVVDSSDSILAVFGSFIAPIFKPLGFGDWRASTALITGLMAKETVVSTLSVLLNIGDAAGLALGLSQLFTPLSAFSFIVFTLLYMPCVATFAAIKREMNSLKSAIGAMAMQTGVAWVITFIIYNIGRLIIH